MSLHCNGCGKDVFMDTLDYYMLKDDVWEEVCKKGKWDTHRVLCKSCAEKALGRKFTPDDMKDVPVNYNYVGDDKILKLTSNDKLKPIEDVEEAHEGDVGKLCTFWIIQEDHTCPVGVLKQAIPGSYMMKGSKFVFNHCRRLTKEEIEKLY